ncbi:ISBma2, transposase [Heyndrickxia coagulans]|nr:ISBma2, transposase [Heyndrickxia coagulans]
MREVCITGKTVGKVLGIGINTPEFYEYSQQQKSEGFKEKYKKRACQEGKNGEMKNFHGLDRAKWYGLKSMGLQAKLTALAVNLKRIAAILSSKKANYSQTFVIFTNFYGKEYHLQKISYTTQQILHKKMAFFSGHDRFKKTFRTRMQHILSFWRFQKTISSPGASCFVLLTASKRHLEPGCNVFCLFDGFKKTFRTHSRLLKGALD